MTYFYKWTELHIVQLLSIFAVTIYYSFTLSFQAYKADIFHKFHNGQMDIPTSPVSILSGLLGCFLDCSTISPFLFLFRYFFFDSVRHTKMVTQQFLSRFMHESMYIL